MRIGILGGGQLARFLLTESHRLGWDTIAYCQSPQDPAYPLHKDNTVGQLNDLRALRRFFSQCDHITFESEFVDVNALRKIPQAQRKCLPSLNLIECFQDKLIQKELLIKNKIPALPALPPKRFKTPLVFKKRRFGYDGYDTHLIKKPAQLRTFIDQHQKEMDHFYAEPLIAFKRELALMVYRTRGGRVGHYPWVEWKAKNAKCWWVKGPCQDKRLKPLTKKLESFLVDTGYVGVMAFEVFDTGSKLYVNELAPRVHNSMHHSLSSMPWNQFQSHLACLHDLPLPQQMTSHTNGYAMVNLIGSGKSVRLVASPETQIFWYGKTDNRPGRKMGHINALSKTPKGALQIALKGAQKCRL